jgi:ubiquinone/menaquinone biosynthesis C-methylase UbiE
MNEGHKFCDSPMWREVVREKLIPWAVQDVGLGDDVLEIGPGYGATTEAFADLLPHVTSVEIDEELAARLQSRYAGTNVEIVHGDATDLQFPDARFTGAVCFSMLHHVPSAEMQNQLFAETARVLRPGAPLVAVDSVETDELRIFHEGDTYHPVDPDSLPERLTNAGFSGAEIRTNEYGWAAHAWRV